MSDDEWTERWRLLSSAFTVRAEGTPQQLAPIIAICNTAKETR